MRALVVAGMVSALLSALSPLARAVDVEDLAAFGSALPRLEVAGNGQGDFTQSIPIEVPPFRGLEPRLSLVYSANGGNGPFGMGFLLTGLSVIERLSGDHGSPRFDDSDDYTIDGSALIEDGSLGGTHCTRMQSFLRIVRLDDGTWVVTQPNGIVSTYGQLLAGGYQTLLTHIRDPHGNEVNVSYGCDQDVCYPATIAYNGATITFSREARPDVDTLGIGGGRIRQMAERINGIAVRVSGDLVRRYELGYSAGAATGRSLLTSVHMVGSDDSTRLPARTFNYDDPSQPGAPLADFVDGSFRSADGQVPLYEVGAIRGVRAKVHFGDVDGNAATDLVRWRLTVDHLLLNVGLSNRDGTFQSSVQSAILRPIRSGFVDHFPLFGDFNGDGKTDALLYEVSTDNRMAIRAAFSNGDGTFRQASYDGVAEGNVALRPFDILPVTADFNGDGRADLLRYRWDPDAQRTVDHLELQVVLSAGDGRFIAHRQGIDFPWRGGTLPGTLIGNALSTPMLADVNADGAVDILLEKPLNCTLTLRVLVSRGDGTFFDSFDAAVAEVCTSQNVIADVNGDGRPDVVRWGFDGVSGIQVVTSLGRGDGTFADGVSADLESGLALRLLSQLDVALLDGDYNGDGRADAVFARHDGIAQTFDVHVFLGRGDGTFASPTRRQVALTPSQILYFNYYGHDFTGDGKSDLIVYYPSYDGLGETLHTRVAAGIGAIEGPMTLVTGELGGSIAVQYRPSNDWPNTNNPPRMWTVSAVTVNDGRGGSSTTRYEYGGGLYDRMWRRFLGFRYVKTTLACIGGEASCPYTETWFHQDYGSPTRPWRVDRRAGSGALLASAFSGVLLNGGSKPYTSFVNGSWGYSFDGAMRRTLVTRVYDAHGNVTDEQSWGDYDRSGDERTVFTRFFPNTAGYLVAYPGQVELRAGIGGSTVLGRSRFFYDGGASFETPPGQGRPTAEHQWLDTSDTYVVTTRTYDSYGNLRTETDPENGTTTFDYDPTFNLFVERTANAVTHVSSASWDGRCGGKTNETDRNGQVTSYQYDALCRVVRVDRPLGGYERHEYRDFGSPTSQAIATFLAGPSGEMTSELWFDGLARAWQTRSTGSEGRTVATQTSYDARGNLASTTDPYFEGDTRPTTTQGFDMLDRLVEVRHPDTSRVAMSYGDSDAGLRTVTAFDELNNAAIEHFDAFGQRIARDELLGVSRYRATYAYNLTGELVQTTDPTGSVTTYGYDSLGRRTSQSDLDRGTQVYAYDRTGRIVGQTLGNGRSVSFTYDAIGRPRTKTTADGTVDYVYDEARSGYFNTGKLTTMSDAHGTEVTDYDAAGRAVRRVRAIDGQSYAFARSYDVGNRLTSITYPDNSIVGFTYNEAGQLAVIPGVVALRRYDAGGRAIEQRNDNGTVTTRSYDGARGWIDAINTTSPSGPVQSLSYGHDLRGLIGSVTSTTPGESFSYVHDDLGRLTVANSVDTPAESRTFAYDAAGNLVSHSALGSYGYASRPHAPDTVGPWTLSYDPAGWLQLWEDSNGSTVASHDAEGRLTAITVTSSATQQATTSSYGYDGNGLRLVRFNGATGTTTHTPGDGLEVVLGGDSTLYVSAGSEMVAKRVGPAFHWLHTDHLGSVQAITDAPGAPVQRLRHGAYGELLGVATTHPEARDFTGNHRDSESGLTHFHARMYSPLFAVFTTPDTIVSSGRNIGLNPYAYANNNPVDHTDPTGRAGDPLWDRLPPGRLMGPVNNDPQVVARFMADAMLATGREPFIVDTAAHGRQWGMGTFGSSPVESSMRGFNGEWVSVTGVPYHGHPSGAAIPSIGDRGSQWNLSHRYTEASIVTPEGLVGRFGVSGPYELPPGAQVVSARNGNLPPGGSFNLPPTAPRIGAWSSGGGAVGTTTRGLGVAAVPGLSEAAAAAVAWGIAQWRYLTGGEAPPSFREMLQRLDQLIQEKYSPMGVDPTTQPWSEANPLGTM